MNTKLRKIILIIVTILIVTGIFTRSNASDVKLTFNEPVVVKYSNEDGNISATIPEWTKYREQDIIRLMGKPDSETTDQKVIGKALERHEVIQLQLFLDNGILTKNEANAFNVQLVDTYYGYIEAEEKLKKLSYDHDQLGIYIDTAENKVVYITPNEKYVNYRSW